MDDNGELWSFVSVHLYNSDFIHRSALFFPWHRVFLFEFENAVRAQGKEFACLTLPVWDWAAANDLRSQKGTINDAWINEDPYLKDMGGSGDQNIKSQLIPSPANTDGIQALSAETLVNVQTAGYGGCGNLSSFSVQELSGPIGAPFNNLRDRTQSCDYPIKFVSCECAQQFPYGGILTRTVDMSGKAPGADTAGLVGDRSENLARMLLNATDYASLRTNFAAAHNRVHAALGASMVSMRSPGDPLFWGHHAYSDYIWDLHTKLHGSSFTCEVCGDILPNVDSTIGGVTGFWLGTQCNDTLDSPMPFSLPTPYYDYEESTYGGRAFLQVVEPGIQKPTGVSDKFWNNGYTPRDVLDLSDMPYSYDSDISVSMYLQRFMHISTFAEQFATTQQIKKNIPSSAEKHVVQNSNNTNVLTETLSLGLVPLIAVLVYSIFAIHRYRRRRHRHPSPEQQEDTKHLLHNPNFYYEDIQ